MRSELAAALAENVTLLMAKHGWKQRDLEKRSGVSQAAIGYLTRYEDGSDRHASVKAVEALGKAFKVPPHMLLVHGYVSGEAQNVHAIAPRQVKQTSPTNEKEALHVLDPDLLEFIAEQAIQHRPGTAKKRAALIKTLYIAMTEGQERPSKATILRLIRSA